MRRIFLPTWFPTQFMRPSVGGAVIMFSAGGTPAASADTRAVPFEVRCLVTDRENRALEGEEVRLTLDAGPIAYEAGRGVAFRTGPMGKQVVHLPGELTPGWIKRPTNFVGSLFSRKEANDDLQLAAELEYLGTRLLYVTKLHRFREDGAVLFGKVFIYAQDDGNNFTREVVRDKDGNWHFPNLDCLVVNDPGQSLARGLFYPDKTDPAGQRWILECQFKRSPPPRGVDHTASHHRSLLMLSPAQLRPEPQTFFAAELAAGNQVADCGPSPHDPQGVLGLVATDFMNRPATRPPGVECVEINDPQWWKAEYVHRPSGHVLAARFDPMLQRRRSVLPL